jgi:hypothetical protein
METIKITKKEKKLTLRILNEWLEGKRDVEEQKLVWLLLRRIEFELIKAHTNDN